MDEEKGPLDEHFDINPNSAKPVEKKEEGKGQMIYFYEARIGWRKKKGNGYTNHYKDVEFVTRAATLEMMNSDPFFIAEIMSSNGLTGSKISNFGVIKVYKVTELGDSMYYKY